MTYLIKPACTVQRYVTWLITCLLHVCSALYCELSVGLSCQAVSSGVAGCSCLPDGPSPTPPPLRLHEVGLVRAASWQLRSRPVWTAYLPVMTMVYGVSHIISHGQVVSVGMEYHIYDIWLIPRIVVLGWVITRVTVLGLWYLREELESPHQLYKNSSTERPRPSAWSSWTITIFVLYKGFFP